MNCNEGTMLELFKKHAASESEAKRVFNLVKNTELVNWRIEDLLSLKGMGRKSALLCMEVACDLQGKK